MVYEIENLFEKFKDLDEHFQLIPGAEGHVLFVPRRNPAFLVGKALHKVDSETDFSAALKESLIDYGTIGRYLKKSHNVSDFATRTTQVVVDTACCNIMGLNDDVGAGLAGGYSAHRIEQMAKAISNNETMSGSLSSLKKFKEGRKRLTLRLRGPKGMGRSIGLPDKPPHPKSEDLFNSTNSTRGGAISLELNGIKNQKSFFNLILENKNKISFVLICVAILYVCFKKFSFVRKFCRKIKKISNHWVFKNRLTRGVLVFWRCTR